MHLSHVLPENCALKALRARQNEQNNTQSVSRTEANNVTVAENDTVTAGDAEKETVAGPATTANDSFMNTTTAKSN